MLNNEIKSRIILVVFCSFFMFMAGKSLGHIQADRWYAAHPLLSYQEGSSEGRPGIINHGPVTYTMPEGTECDVRSDDQVEFNLQCYKIKPGSTSMNYGMRPDGRYFRIIGNSMHCLYFDHPKTADQGIDDSPEVWKDCP